ncbi:MAG: hypothetical protein HPY69_07600 [Armatimonadetes bacterium]|nr:hypothetical protein [Armatimonadota bacterium]
MAVNNSVVNRREFQLMHAYGADMRVVDLGPGEDVTEQSDTPVGEVHIGVRPPRSGLDQLVG